MCRNVSCLSNVKKINPKHLRKSNYVNGKPDSMPCTIFLYNWSSKKLWKSYEIARLGLIKMLKHFGVNKKLISFMWHIYRYYLNSREICQVVCDFVPCFIFHVQSYSESMKPLVSNEQIPNQEDKMFCLFFFNNCWWLKNGDGFAPSLPIYSLVLTSNKWLRFIFN